ncbi:hypothetical protein EAI_06997 [Harpegnathos saltator]|uniref:Uncharacterized protein n=1 Tax=Harpegnathos saltator TaxID=610380 RepID=E2C4J3_HARSA|nr:hypothetical protein EAI_06997 [Harpegnathos saltator]
MRFVKIKREQTVAGSSRGHATREFFRLNLALLYGVSLRLLGPAPPAGYPELSGRWWRNVVRATSAHCPHVAISTIGMSSDLVPTTGTIEDYSGSHDIATVGFLELANRRG